ncbi:hypothetical protein CBS101457_003447 [Exobasidium rhododendri]|nr:hypothetical protein CBS101457_003447 [Exobasidium rhododendri]
MIFIDGLAKAISVVCVLLTVVGGSPMNLHDKGKSRSSLPALHEGSSGYTNEGSLTSQLHQDVWPPDDADAEDVLRWITNPKITCSYPTYERATYAVADDDRHYRFEEGRDITRHSSQSPSRHDDQQPSKQALPDQASTSHQIDDKKMTEMIALDHYQRLIDSLNYNEDNAAILFGKLVDVVAFERYKNKMKAKKNREDIQLPLLTGLRHIASVEEFKWMGSDEQKKWENALNLLKCNENQKKTQHPSGTEIWSLSKRRSELEHLTADQMQCLSHEQKDAMAAHQRRFNTMIVLGRHEDLERIEYTRSHLALRNMGIPLPEPGRCHDQRILTLEDHKRARERNNEDRKMLAKLNSFKQKKVASSKGADVGPPT